MSIHIVVVDNHTMFRQGLVSYLSDYKDFKIVGTAGNGDDLLGLLESCSADIVLLDYEMPKYSGIELVHLILGKHPDLKVIMVSMHNDKHKVEKLAEEGIRAYVSKECDLDILRQAILEVQQNGYYFNENFPKELLQQLINENKIRPNYRFTAFSERELQIIRLICQEKTTAEIADQLCLSPRTIEGIRASILDRIAARSTIGLVMYAMKHGLVPPK